MTAKLKDVYEQLILDVVIESIPDMSPELKYHLECSTTQAKRAKVLAILEENNVQNRQMFRSIRKEIENDSFWGDVSQTRHIANIVNMLRDYVKVSKVEKKSFGEVMTPISLVEDMLDTLPKEVWSNPELKWLDPCNGVGIFPAIAVQRLMDGLKEWQPDEDKRYQHIMEEMLYVCELQAKNLFLYMYAFDPEDKYDLNIYNGSFLDDGFDRHMREYLGVEKFDVIMANPPYNQMLDLQFLEKCHKIADKILFVHPSTWIIDEKMKQKKFINARNLINDDLVSIKMFNGNGVFGIGLFVPCVITYIDKDYNGKIKVIDKINDNEIEYENIFDINKYNSKEYLSIKEKISKHGEYIHQHLNDQPKKYWVNLAQIRGNVEQRNGFNKILKNDFYTLITKDKKVELEKRKQASKTQYSFNSLEEANNFLNYVKTDFVRFCLSIYKNNANCHRGEVNLIPWLDFTQEWTDEKLYKYFNLTAKEIAFIEKVIPKYY